MGRDGDHDAREDEVDRQETPEYVPRVRRPLARVKVSADVLDEEQDRGTTDGHDPLAVGPTDAAARRLWNRDFRVLARIDLLSGDFPPEMVLHVAAAGSPADFFRAIKAYSPNWPKRKPK